MHFDLTIFIYFCLGTVKSWAIIIGNNILDILKTVDNTEEDACLVIIANNSIKTLVTIFAAVLFNIPVRIMQHDPNLKKSHLESMLHKANPFAVLVFDETLLEDIALEKLTPNLKLVLYTGAPSLKAIYTNIEVVNWDDFMINKDYNPKGTWLTTYPEQQVHKPLLGTIFMCKASGAPFDTPVPAVAAFTNNQIMSAIVAQKAFLPREAQLTKNDKLLLLTPVCNMYTIIHQLTALIECASLVFLEDQNVSFEETMNALKPTVLVCNDYTSLLLSSYSKNLGLLERARFAKSSSSIRRGTLRRRAVIPFLAPLRLIYTHQLIYPYLHNEFEKNKTKLDQQSCNDLRALAGAAVIHGLVSPMIAGPICQTTIADYRLLHGNMDVGQEHGGKSFARNSTLINFGPPMGSLEYNVSDYTGSHLAEKFNAGSLQVRGNSTCLESSSWVDTGINVMIGADGCVKLISR